jgi:polyisoprenoid-binding protein YceI
MKPAVFSWVLAGLAMTQVQTDTYRFDAVQSRIEVRAFSGGAFGIFGHDHTIEAKRFSGAINYEPGRLERSSVTFVIPSSSLTVLDPGVSEKDRREVQETMEGPRVLNVLAFPEISFRSTRLDNLKQTGQEWEGTLTGTLGLHGIERSVTFPIRVRIENNRLIARGEASIDQKEFGITPISLAGGTVRVRDRVKITFSLMAERKQP